MLAFNIKITRLKAVLLPVLVLLTLCSHAQNAGGFIKVSKINPRYFTVGSKQFWLPVELNYVINIRNSPEAIFADAEHIFKTFSANGGNAVRIWGPTPFLEVETRHIGNYDQLALQRFSRFISLAKKYHLRVKFNLESSRSFTSGYFIKKLYGANDGGPFGSFAQFINSAEGRQAYLNRAKAYIQLYRHDPTVYCWELWNEMSAISEGNWLDFSRVMLDSVKRIAPAQLVSQTLGSLAYKQTMEQYLQYLQLKNNDIACLHQYLDPGAQLPMCYGPVDEMLSQSVAFVRGNSSGRPVFVNETGAVEAAHSAMSHYYNLDTAGMLLHDMLFAPFFSGAAGPGSFWLDEPYMDKHHLWYHYQRFNTAVKDFNCITEKPEVIKFTQQGLRVYALKGHSSTLIWCRDSSNTYIKELQQGVAPLIKRNTVLQLRNLNAAAYTKARVYDPWKNTWQQVTVVNQAITLPAFTRSVVVRLSR